MRKQTEAKVSLERGLRYTNQIPYLDLKNMVKKYTKDIWQLRWNNAEAKLKEIKPIISQWPTHTNRKNDVLLTRLRIGHTKMTHGYLMTGERPPEGPRCCDERLTVKHILTECQTHREQRTKYKLPSNMAALLGQDCPLEDLLEYLKDIEMLAEV